MMACPEGKKEQKFVTARWVKTDVALQQQAADRGVYPGECGREIPHLESGR